MRKSSRNLIWRRKSATRNKPRGHGLDKPGVPEHLCRTPEEHTVPSDRSLHGEHLPASLTPDTLFQRDSTHLRSDLAAYDDALLERACTQWQFGDWRNLAKLDKESIRHHPEKAKLALLAAAGNLQVGNTVAAHTLLRLAREWGCKKNLIARLLVAGVHNSLGKASAIVGQENNALRHFEASIRFGTPNAEVQLLIPARINLQLGQLGAPFEQETGSLRLFVKPAEG